MLKSGYDRSALDKIYVHPGHCYLRAKHGHEQSEEREFKR